MSAFGNEISFSEYKDRATGAKVDMRSTSDILAELDAAENELKGGKRYGDGDI